MNTSAEHIRNDRLSRNFCAIIIAVSSFFLFMGAASILTARPLFTILELGWAVPGGSLHVGVDRLSGFFLIPIALLASICAYYSRAYMAHIKSAARLAGYWICLALLTGAMFLTVTARNGLLFLMAWELMALSSFFLVMFEDEHREVRDAGWQYLIASHAGTACLLALFALLGSGAGSLEFDRMLAFGAQSPSLCGLAFVLALAGFGVKAGLIPAHVWLPDAHPAAPSPVSALMSGVMIKTGIYGLLRILTFLGTPPAWWGLALIGLGLVSGLLGMLYSLAQHDIKRALAYSSVENMGIIAMALGIGLTGISCRLPAVALLGFAGALLHIMNHAFFKGLLFLAAGAAVHSSGTRDINRLGGLLKRMPRTGFMFAVGAAAICGLPPLNGFVSEFLIYSAAASGIMSGNYKLFAPAVCVLTGLAIIGGLSAAGFTRLFGTVFLGEPRGKNASLCREAPAAMLGAMAALTALCILPGICAPLAFMAVRPAAVQLSGVSAAAAAETGGRFINIAMLVSLVALFFLCAAALLHLLRARLLRRRDVARSVTWDCGYAEPAARMQYTASSFAQPITGMFSALLNNRLSYVAPRGLFPALTYFGSEPRDAFREYFFAPLFQSVHWIFVRLRWLQHGHLHIYVLYIAMAALALVLFAL